VVELHAISNLQLLVHPKRCTIYFAYYKYATAYQHTIGGGGHPQGGVQGLVYVPIGCSLQSVGGGQLL
jgi:hypothetical protein